MADLLTIRATAKRLKSENMPVAEYRLRCWVKTGELPSIPCGQKRLLLYPVVLGFLRNGGAGGGGRHGTDR